MSLLLRRHAFGLLATCAMTACVASNDRMAGLVFDPGADTAELADQISGDESVMYRFQAKDGQFLSVSLQSDSEDTEMVVYAPAEWPGDVLFNSETSGGREYEGSINTDGVHAVKVFQNQEASKQGAISTYEVVITLMDG